MARKSFLAFGCVHQPIADPGGVDWLIDEIADRQPDVVVNTGDLIDTNCLSSFRGRSAPNLDEEFSATGEFLQRVADAAGQAKLVWMMGNHEQRIFREEWSHLSGLLDYRRQITEAAAWKHFDYRYHPKACYRMGQVTFGHGWTAGVASCKREAVYLGVPNGLYVHSHTHRPHPVHRISMGTTKLPYWHANVGTFIDPEIDYMATKDDSGWGMGLVSGWANTKRVYGPSTDWDAETVIHRMYWDNEDTPNRAERKVC
ncbi:MAG: metallophosphoesterase [Planctomycetota bacterium]